MDQDGRPLADLILNDAEYKNLFTHFVDFYTNQVFREDQWRNYGDSIKALIRPYVALDTYYPRDYGFNMDAFDNSYDTNFRYGHVERGLYEFMRKRRESTNGDISFSNTMPSIYHQEFSQVGADANIHAAVFSKDGIQSVSLITFNHNKSSLSTVAMNRNRKAGTSLIEEYDDWALDLTLNGTERYYQIVARDSIGRQRTWPRSGYAKFEQGSNSNLALYINEFMASNNSTIADPANEYDDWVEIYNASSVNLDLEGMFLSDNPNNLDKWNFPSGTNIDAGDFLIVWCDEDGDKDQDGFHANFKLSANGEFVVLVDSDSISVIDYIAFGPQTTDISFGRSQDGGSDWITFENPTPGNSNIGTGINELIPMSTILYPNYPNPFNPTTVISFQLSDFSTVDLSIYSIAGKRITSLINEAHDAGIYTITWNASNMPSGVYLAVMKIDGRVYDSQKMLLVK